jgi:hypothetical protein
MNTVIFNQVECEVKILSYPTNFRPRIVLIEKETGLQFANATINTDSRIDTRFVFVKDYSENEGIYKALLDAKIIKCSKKKIEVGLCEAYVCELNLCMICENNQSITNLCDKHIKENL